MFEYVGLRVCGVGGGGERVNGVGVLSSQILKSWGVRPPCLNKLKRRLWSAVNNHTPYSWVCLPAQSIPTHPHMADTCSLANTQHMYDFSNGCRQLQM